MLIYALSTYTVISLIFYLFTKENFVALNNSQYQAIMREYDERKTRNRDILQTRYDEVYSRIPELEALDHSVSTLSVQKAKQLLLGANASLEADSTPESEDPLVTGQTSNSEDALAADLTPSSEDALAAGQTSNAKDTLSSLGQELQALSRKRAKLLKANGFPSDYLEPIYDCKECADTGYIDNKKCHCFRRAIIDLFYTQSNLKEMLEIENFNSFSLDYYSKNFLDSLRNISARDIAEESLKICQQFVKNFSSQAQNLLITGLPGLGKTFLTHCIAGELIQDSYSVIYFTASEFFELCAKHAFRQEARAEFMEDQFTACDLLIIDDLGTELPNSFTTSQLFIYINERILQKKSTLISTNLSLSDLNTLYGERIFSRIGGSYDVIRLVGDDIRIQKKLTK